MGAPDLFFAAALATFLLGAISGLATWKRPTAARIVAFAFAVLGSLLLIVASGRALAFPTSAAWNLPLVTLFPCTVRLDPLSAWFPLALGIFCLAVSVYSFGYLRPMERNRNLGALGFFYNALLLGLALVFTAANAFFFLSAWEVMAVSAFCLVVFEHEKAEGRDRHHFPGGQEEEGVCRREDQGQAQQQRIVEEAQRAQIAVALYGA